MVYRTIVCNFKESSVSKGNGRKFHSHESKKFNRENALDRGGSKISMEKKKCSMVIVFMQCDKINLKGRKKDVFLQNIITIYL